MPLELSTSYMYLPQPLSLSLAMSVSLPSLRVIIMITYGTRGGGAVTAAERIVVRSANGAGDARWKERGRRKLCLAARRVRAWQRMAPSSSVVRCGAVAVVVRIQGQAKYIWRRLSCEKNFQNQLLELCLQF